MPRKARVVHGRGTDRQAREARPVDLDPHPELTVEVILARHGPLRDHEVQIGLVLGHSPNALAALDRDFGADRQVDHILAGPVVPGEEGGHEPGSRAFSVRAGNRDRELHIAPDVGYFVVHDGNDERAAVSPEPKGVHLVALDQLGRLANVYREDRHEGGRVFRVHREGEADAVDECVAPGLLLEALRDLHWTVPFSSSLTMTGKTSSSAR